MIQAADSDRNSCVILTRLLATFNQRRLNYILMQKKSILQQFDIIVDDYSMRTIFFVENIKTNVNKQVI
ncbi:MAG: hypothetical protein KPI85_08235 [cyanobacterium endosymbiont of Epithemia adnata isolate EadnSB Bon19]